MKMRIVKVETYGPKIIDSRIYHFLEIEKWPGQKRWKIETTTRNNPGTKGNGNEIPKDKGHETKMRIRNTS